MAAGRLERERIDRRSPGKVRAACPDRMEKELHRYGRSLYLAQRETWRLFVMSRRCTDGVVGEDKTRRRTLGEQAAGLVRAVRAE